MQHVKDVVCKDFDICVLYMYACLIYINKDARCNMGFLRDHHYYRQIYLVELR